MSTASQSKPRASIVIEWENIQLAEHSRCLEMLRSLARQIDEVYAASPEAGGFEVILLYNNDGCSVDDIRPTVEPFFPAAETHRALRLEATPGLNYYSQKNRGAELASSELVVFIDSDVIPEDNWLTSLLAPFSYPQVQCVCGNTYLTTSGVYSKAFALFWFFPLRARNDVFEKKKILFANNLAMRRSTILSHPFLPVAGTARGWCLALSHHLRDHGIDIYYNSAARVTHPAPFGLSHFVNRALVQGRDQVLMRRAMGKGKLMRNFHNAMLMPVRAIWKILRDRRQVELSLVETPVAMIVALAYSLIAVGGYLATLIAPGYTQRHWHI